jgi:hypothetical protein
MSRSLQTGIEATSEPFVASGRSGHVGNASVQDVSQSPGRPLDPGTRRYMEPRFGHDFSHVRVHTDASAAESARTIGAAAYTVGRDVVFGARRYSPGTRAGRQLLAHELAHVVQQGVRAAVPGMGLAMSDRKATTEQEAESASGAVAEGHFVTVTARPVGHVARQEVDGGPPGSAAPACPVRPTGTLSEVSWGETSGLYPTSANKYQSEKWDSAKTCELLRARGAVHAVGGRGESVHTGKPRASDPLEQKLKVYHLVENFPALDPEIADPAVRWFYLSVNANGPDVHPGTTGTARVKSYGSFHNVGGGDVPKGPVYIHFYRLAPK